MRDENQQKCAGGSGGEGKTIETVVVVVVMRDENQQKYGGGGGGEGKTLETVVVVMRDEHQ